MSRPTLTAEFRCAVGDEKLEVSTFIPDYAPGRHCVTFLSTGTGDVVDLAMCRRDVRILVSILQEWLEADDEQA